MRIVQEKNSNKFLVPSSTGKDTYHVDIHQPFCECRDFIMTRMRASEECKHIRKVKTLLAEAPQEQHP
ncbi:MAG: hypothetical protein HC945_00700 [Nitrosarchaeum sp.]|nr:hypothetical protein [Nitrosarchaeum sp.]